jgi:hypothetical protein
MRKEDRIRQQQSQQPSEPQREKTKPRPSEKMRGSASGEQQNKPPREPGKMPLPD